VKNRQNFGKFSGSDRANNAKEATKIICSIFLCMSVTIPGTHGITVNVVLEKLTKWKAQKRFQFFFLAGF
jgi:hypothetical protein